MKNSNLTVILSFTILSLFSCSEQKKEEKQAKKEVEKLELNEKTCVNFAKNLHQSFVTGDSNFIQQYIILDSLKSTVFTKYNLENNPLNNIAWSLVSKKLGIGADFRDAIDNDGQIRFISYYKDSIDLSHHIILRSFFPPMGVNFYDFELSSHNNGLQIVDVYDYSTPGELSDILGEEMYFLSKSKLSEDSIGIFHTYLEEHTLNIQNQIKNGNVRLAYKLFLQFPDILKQSRKYRNLEEQILFASDEPEVHEQFIASKLASLNPDSRDSYLTSFYKHGIFREFDLALTSIENLEKSVGEDEVLHFLRGMTYLENEQFDLAVETFNTAISEDPNIFIYQWSKVIALVEKGAYELAVETLLVMDDFFVMVRTNWDKEFIAYPEFLFSEAFEIWQNRMDV
jgi:tetratricopeptide (TPR) repeat protein